MMNLRELIRSVAHPSYTGEARRPGFVVGNVLLVSLLAVGAEAVVPPSGTLIIGVGLILLALRGYALPGLPWILAVAGRWRGGRDADRLPRDETELVRVGVLTERAGELRLTDSFIRAWRQNVLAMGERSEDAVAFARVMGFDPSRVRLEWRNDLLVAELDNRPLAAWLSRAAFVADLGSIAELRRRTLRWDGLSPGFRGSVLATIRLYLDSCPLCDGALTLTCAPARTSLFADTVVVVTCTACDARLFESGFNPTVAAGASAPRPLDV